LGVFEVVDGDWEGLFYGIANDAEFVVLVAVFDVLLNAIFLLIYFFNERT